MSPVTQVDFTRCTVKAAGRQIQGARSEQEDSFLLLPQADCTHPQGHFLALVADGMGGMGGGREASQTVAKAYAEAWLAPGTDLADAMKTANAALAEQKAAGRATAQSGTTLAVLEVTPRGCSWLHVGDSYIFLFKDGNLTRVNTPLNMQWWREQKRSKGQEITPEEAETDGQILYAALCGDELRAVETSKTADASPGCRYIVASDGIAPIFENGTLQTLLCRPDVATAPPETVAEHILKAEAALNLKHQDNATVIVADIVPLFSSEDTEQASSAMITYSKVSELGDRDTQQDNEGCWVSADAAFAVVADGAGGYSNSEMASAHVVYSMKECWKNALCCGVDAEAAGRIIAGGALKAHRRVLEQSGGDTKRCGKSAFVALYMHKGKYAVVHVGDCRAYLGRGKNWKALTKDDSMLQRLLDSGKISPAEAKDSPEQSVLLQAIGAANEPTPHVAVGSYKRSDAFLLCCDGFWNQLPDDLWGKFAWCPPAMDRQHALESMAQSAVENADGDSDNVSAIWLHPQVYISPTAALVRTSVLAAAALALLAGFSAIAWQVFQPRPRLEQPAKPQPAKPQPQGETQPQGESKPQDNQPVVQSTKPGTTGDPLARAHLTRDDMSDAEVWAEKKYKQLVELLETAKDALKALKNSTDESAKETADTEARAAVKKLIEGVGSVKGSPEPNGTKFNELLDRKQDEQDEHVEMLKALIAPDSLETKDVPEKLGYEKGLLEGPPLAAVRQYKALPPLLQAAETSLKKLSEQETAQAPKDVLSQAAAEVTKAVEELIKGVEAVKAFKLQDYAVLKEAVDDGDANNKLQALLLLPELTAEAVLEKLGRTESLPQDDIGKPGSENSDKLGISSPSKQLQ